MEIPFRKDLHSEFDGEVPDDQNPMKNILTKRIIIAAAAILAGLLIVFYSKMQPGRVADPEALTDINNIETLRTQFNLDAGKTRLILLVSPT